MTFDKKIVIQSLAVTSDANGNQVQTYTDLYTTWANVNSLYGDEYWAAQGQGQENTLTFTVRWFAAIDTLLFDSDITKYRIKFNNHFFNIKHFDNVEFKNMYVKIKAVAR